MPRIGSDPSNLVDPLGLYSFPRVWDRAIENFQASNEILAGQPYSAVKAVTLGIIGSHLAGRAGLPTIGEAVKVLWHQLKPGALRGLPLGIPALGLGGTVAGAAVTKFLVTGLVVAGTFEAGLFAGSLLGASIEEFFEDDGEFDAPGCP